MAPNLIKGLLDYWAFPMTVDHHNTGGNVIARLDELGLIREKSHPVDRGQVGYEVTPKGKAYIEAVQAVDMPECQWVVPTPV